MRGRLKLSHYIEHMRSVFTEVWSDFSTLTDNL